MVDVGHIPDGGEHDADHVQFDGLVRATGEQTSDRTDLVPGAGPDDGLPQGGGPVLDRLSAQSVQTPVRGGGGHY